MKLKSDRSVSLNRVTRTEVINLSPDLGCWWEKDDGFFLAKGSQGLLTAYPTPRATLHMWFSYTGPCKERVSASVLHTGKQTLGKVSPLLNDLTHGSTGPSPSHFAVGGPPPNTSSLWIPPPGMLSLPQTCMWPVPFQLGLCGGLPLFEDSWNTYWRITPPTLPPRDLSLPLPSQCDDCQSTHHSLQLMSG
jgi:hypothetical protein